MIYELSTPAHALQLQDHEALEADRKTLTAPGSPWPCPIPAMRICANREDR
jgi:hypothetical protein